METNSAGQFSYIDSQPDLRTLVERMKKADRVAIDTEADSLHHYYEKVCLIQLSLLGETYIVDPLAQMNLDAFLEELAHKSLILHGAEYDLRMLWASHQFRPRGELFDTMLAAQLVEGEARSLVALAEKYAGVELSKQGRKSDWSRRPLTDKQLAYAGNDTRYLETIAGKLKQELKKLGRLDWHRESCRRMIKVTANDKPEPDPERVWRIKGLSNLDRRQQAFVREIWYWRDSEARRSDTPPFKVMGNSLILDLALWASTTRSRSLRKGPRLPRNCVNRRLKALERAIEKARRLPESDWPDFLRRGGNGPIEYGPELDKLRADCNRLAAKLGLESSLVASRKQLETIVLARPKTKKELQSAGQLMNWQTDLLASVVKRIFHHS